jgi:hypothetical protein
MEVLLDSQKKGTDEKIKDKLIIFPSSKSLHTKLDLRFFLSIILRIY